MSQNFTLSLTMKKLFFGFIFFVFAFNFSQAQNCNAILSVEKDRNVRSADSDGTSFTLELENTSKSPQTFNIAYKQLEQSCAPENKIVNSPNVTLNIQFQEAQSRGSNINTLSLSGGEKKKFKVFVSVPSNTKLGNWSCVEIQATTNECKQASTTLLKVYVPKSSNG